MEGNNWSPEASQGELDFDSTSEDWRSQLHPDARQRIVNKIMETLKRHLPTSGPEGISELKKIAVRFEEKIYTAATNQSDYLRRISAKMLSMESKTQGTVATNSSPSNLGVANSNSADSVEQDNFLNVRTPPPPSVRTYDIAVPPLYHDQPIERRCNWAANTSKKLMYIFSNMAADVSDERKALAQKEAQAKEDLEAVKADLAVAVARADEKAKLAEDLAAKLAAAKAEVTAKEEALEANEVAQVETLENLLKLRDLDKEKWEAKERELLAQIEKLKNSTVSQPFDP